MSDIYHFMPWVSNLIPYDYPQIRNSVYDLIIEDYLSHFNSQRRPVFIQVGGIPGAGKTTFCNKLAKGLYLSFDHIMESIPAYQQDLYLLGHIKAFEKWEIPARIIGYEILRRAILARFNIVLEHSGVNPAHLQLFRALNSLGYETNMYFIFCPLKLALQRAIEREKITHRFTPPEMIQKRFSMIEEYLPQYKALAHHTYLYDSSTNNFVLKNSFSA